MSMREKAAKCEAIWHTFPLSFFDIYGTIEVTKSYGIAGDFMSYFGRLYLDKEKDIVVRLDMENSVLSYTIYADNYQKDNVISNLARIANQETVIRNGRKVIVGEIPCYIKGDGRRVYIFRLNGMKLANIYPNGDIEVNSLIPAKR